MQAIKFNSPRSFTKITTLKTRNIPGNFKSTASLKESFKGSFQSNLFKAQVQKLTKQHTFTLPKWSQTRFTSIPAFTFANSTGSLMHIEQVHEQKRTLSEESSLARHLASLSTALLAIIAAVVGVAVFQKQDLSEPLMSYYGGDDDDDEDEQIPSYYDEGVFDDKGPKYTPPEESLWDKAYWSLFDLRQTMLKIHNTAMDNFREWWGHVDNVIGNQPRIGPFILPDRLEPPWGHVWYTLVAELKVFVIQRSPYTLQHSYALTKRPAADYFIKYIGNFMEIIIYTDEVFRFSMRAVHSLDPDRDFIRYNLFREQCRRGHGRWIKQLRHMNRPLDSTIVLDYAAENWDIPENVLVMPKWDGDRTDTLLLDLVPFLQDIALQHIHDVRPVIQRVNTDPSILDEYKFQRMAKEREERPWDVPADIYNAIYNTYENDQDHPLDSEDDEEFLTRAMPGVGVTDVD